MKVIIFKACITLMAFASAIFVQSGIFDLANVPNTLVVLGALGYSLLLWCGILLAFWVIWKKEVNKL